ncbi:MULTISPECIES: hypothetical protein [Variovorax]|jgi:hypothetical protein|uniref:hypothetical protein n=1 Tax=Variovorax TaxID=34072 RepID=UPI000A4087CB|nr:MULTISPECIES: hypothetical protein [Variovorax]MBN8755866.1 hypothetical protein [Variovorax sp.]UKI06603.1 hypothetical protein L3V85_27875 [Variovorax paradoxus]
MKSRASTLLGLGTLLLAFAGALATTVSARAQPVVVGPPPLVLVRPAHVVRPRVVVVRPAYVVPAGVVYVRPTYAMPGPGYAWRYRVHGGWGWYHPSYGWYRR